MVTFKNTPKMKYRYISGEGVGCWVVYDIEDLQTDEDTVKFKALVKVYKEGDINNLGNLCVYNTTITRPSTTEYPYWSSIVGTARLLERCKGQPTPITISADGEDFGISYDLLDDPEHTAVQVRTELNKTYIQFLKYF